MCIEMCAFGWINVTWAATDMAILAGNNPESCYAKYGSVPLRSKACHEQALRILLRCIESHATRYGRYIKPLLSISADFYIRVFVRVFTSPLQCKLSSSKQSMYYQCTGCQTLSFQPLGILKPNPTEKNPNQFKYGLPVVPSVSDHCPECHNRYHMGEWNRKYQLIHSTWIFFIQIYLITFFKFLLIRWANLDCTNPWFWIYWYAVRTDSDWTIHKIR